MLKVMNVKLYSSTKREFYGFSTALVKVVSFITSLLCKWFHSILYKITLTLVSNHFIFQIQFSNEFVVLEFLVIAPRNGIIIFSFQIIELTIPKLNCCHYKWFLITFIKFNNKQSIILEKSIHLDWLLLCNHMQLEKLESTSVAHGKRVNLSYYPFHRRPIQ